LSFHFFEFKLTIGFIALLKEQFKDKSGTGVVSKKNLPFKRQIFLVFKLNPNF